MNYFLKLLSALIGGKPIFTKNPLQVFLSSLNAVILTNKRTEFITGHVIFKLRYNQIHQLKTTKFSYWRFGRQR